MFILLFFFFPTILLTFAYPTKMIVIFAFVVAYLFATSVFSAAIVKFYKYNKYRKKTKSYQLQCCKHSANQDKEQMELQDIQNNPQQCSQEQQPKHIKSISKEQSNKCCDIETHQILRRMSEFLHYFLLYFMPLWIIILYLHFLMLFILYTVMIGRATVITTGPTFIISLFMPALLSSIAAAILKKTTIIKQAKNGEEMAESGISKHNSETESKDIESTA